jgi:hypothetical protein
MRKIILAASAAALGLGAGPALAQVNTGSGNGLVAVNIQNVDILKNFLNNDQISLLDNVSVPVTVQVPVGVAANVCGVNANVIAQQKGTGTYSCDAKTGSKALAQNFVTQVLNQKRGK